MPISGKNAAKSLKTNIVTTPGTNLRKSGTKQKTKRVWTPKSSEVCHMVFSAVKTDSAGAWNFDSGCSRHMTGNHAHLRDIVALSKGTVTYGGGGKSRIIGKGTLNVQ